MSKWSFLGYIDYNKIRKVNKIREVITLPFDLGNSISVIEIPEWAKTDDVLESRSEYIQSDIRKTEYVLRKDYDAESIGSLQQKVDEEINIARLAIWLAKPTSFNLFFGAHFDDINSCPSSRQSYKVVKFRLQPQDQVNVLTMNDLDLAKDLNVSLSLIEKDTPIWIAIKFLYKALMEELWEVQYSLKWFAMEALFGSNQEITYRLSLRAAKFLSNSNDQAKDYFSKIKKGYRLRSTIVHGSKIRRLSPEESLNSSYNIQEFLRKALIKILLNNSHIENFNSRDRDKFLDDMIFDT